jgi:hypothetical protein
MKHVKKVHNASERHRAYVKIYSGLHLPDAL